MSNYCNTCQHYRVTNDGPHCFKGKAKPVSPLSTGECWEHVTAPPQLATKVCSRCGRELPISNFGRHSRTKDGYQPCCRECQSQMNKGHKKRGPFEHNEAPAKPEEPEKIPDGMKKCSRCGKILPVSEFRKHKDTPDGLQYYCKECQVTATAEAKKKRDAKKKDAVKAKTIEKVQDVFNDIAVPFVDPAISNATDDQLVEELKRRGYTGSIIRKTTFIL